MNDQINVTKTYIPDVNKYKKYVDKIFSSGWLTNNGEVVQELEKRLAKYLGVQNLVLVANGTLALQVAYKVLDIKGEALTTPFSFVATTSSLIWENIRPVFADIDSSTFNIDPSKIEKYINSNTSAIIPVHVFGNACDIDEIESIAKNYSLKTVYDSAHAFGVNYKNKGIGNFGDASTFSFHSTKIFHTIEGGAIVFKDEEMYKKAKLMINFGIPGPDRVIELGINAKMNEFQAAMGLCVLDDINTILNNRKNIFEKYITAFSSVNNIKLQDLNKNASLNYSYFPVVFNSEETLLKIKEKLNSENIYPRRYFYPSLETLTYLKETKKMENSSSISKRILCLPIFESLSSDVQDKIIKIIRANI